MTRLDQFRQPQPAPARTRRPLNSAHFDMDITPAVDAALIELGITDEPAPMLEFDEGLRYRDLLIAINGRAMAEHGIEYIPRDPTIPPGEDYDLRPHQIEIEARNMLVLYELAGQLGMDISNF